MTARRAARTLVALSLAVALLALLLDLRDAGPSLAVRGWAGVVAGPPERAMAWVRRQVTDRVGSTEDAQRVAALEDEVERLRADASRAARQQLQEGEARELAALAPAAGYRRVPARLVALSPPTDQVRSVTVAAGTRAGVGIGMPVMARGGMAGLVDSVSPEVATVRLLVDPATSLPARIASSGEVGVLTGTGRAATFELLDPLGQMARGDLVVTIGAGADGLPADLPLGRVRAISGSAADLSRAAEVAPHVDDSTLDRVEVLVPEDPPASASPGPGPAGEVQP